MDANPGPVTGIGSHTACRSGETDDWLTPPYIIDALGPFDLDPCASVGQPWRTAATQWTVHDPQRPYFGMVWCNPPYGPETWRWLHRLADHGQGIALVFARTETQGFVSAVWDRATAVLFLHGRLHFHYGVTGARAAGNAGGPSCLVAYGADAETRLRTPLLAGSLVRLGANKTVR